MLARAILLVKQWLTQNIPVQQQLPYVGPAAQRVTDQSMAVLGQVQHACCNVLVVACPKLAKEQLKFLAVYVLLDSDYWQHVHLDSAHLLPLLLLPLLCVPHRIN